MYILNLKLDFFAQKRLVSLDIAATVLYNFNGEEYENRFSVS